MGDSVTVLLEDDAGTILKTFVIEKATVATTARRFSLTSGVMEREGIKDHEKGMLLNCCALAATLKDENGVLHYPDDETAVDLIYNEMEYDLFQELVNKYLDVNPIGKGFTAKKKKS